MKRIYKYPLEITNIQTIEMPTGAEILTVQTQNEQPCIWAMVDPETPHSRPHNIEIIGTGHPIRARDRNRRYLGTCQMGGGSLVWHVFELFEP